MEYATPNPASLRVLTVRLSIHSFLDIIFQALAFSTSNSGTVLVFTPVYLISLSFSKVLITTISGGLKPYKLPFH